MLIFLVDDERILRVSLADELKDAGHEVMEFSEARGALKMLDEQHPDMVITDIRMPGMDGLELLEKIKNISPATYVVIMTAYASVNSAIKALKLGAYDYLSKPFRSEEVLHLVSRISELREVKEENKRLHKQVSGQFNRSGFIGESLPVKEMFDLIGSIADSNASVLITGETGTGKELLANIIHYSSYRKNKPFVKVSCAVLAKDVIESELFGHVKGAFTGADQGRKGRFEIANHGTLYLDDIDDIPLGLQVKLLRALQEQEIEAVGSSEPLKIDVRVIASTKFDLKKLVSEGRFREDLYYRLNVIPVNIPAVRERVDDIPLLVNYFAEFFSPASPVSFSGEALTVLHNYYWPGNVRELRNLIERLCLIYPGKVIRNDNIPAEYHLIHNNHNVGESEWDLEEIINKTEAGLISAALSRSGGNKTKASELLGIPLSTFRTKAAKHGIQ